MTRAQRVVILIGLLVIAGLLLFPPWYGKEYTYNVVGDKRWSTAPGTHHHFAGHHLVLTSRDQVFRRLSDVPLRVGLSELHIDKDRLLLECLFVVVVTGGIVFWLDGRKKQPNDNKTQEVTL